MIKPWMFVPQVSEEGPEYSPVYPAFDVDHVKATTFYSAGYYPHFAFDPSKPLTGSGDQNNTWHTSYGTVTNQRCHVDLGAEFCIKRIWYEGFYNAGGGETNFGPKDFTFWGSNEANAFNELAYAIDTDWTQLTTDISQFLQHSSNCAPDYNYISVTNNNAYRYYAFKFANTWGGTILMSNRRLVLYQLE